MYVDNALHRAIVYPSEVDVPQCSRALTDFRVVIRIYCSEIYVTLFQLESKLLGPDGCGS